jgi:hypothetical protein
LARLLFTNVSKGWNDMIGSRNVSASLAIGLIAAFFTMMTAAAAEDEDKTVSERVSVGVNKSKVSLIKPKEGQPEASVILMPGDDGNIDPDPVGEITNELENNQLVRTRRKYAVRGLAVMVVNADTNLASAVKYMRDIKRPVTIVATSRGTIRAAEGIAGGARPDYLVLTSGTLSPESGSPYNVESILRSPKALPQTLVIHHKKDGCDTTRPKGVDPFIRWSEGRARAHWVEGGDPKGPPCKALHYHGFPGHDVEVVSLVVKFRPSSLPPSSMRDVATPLATPLPTTVVGKWTYRDYDRETGRDKSGYTTVFEVSEDGTVKGKDGSTGKVVSYGDNEIKIQAAKGPYKTIITWHPQAAIGNIFFLEAPHDSGKRKNPGPYDISMRRN